MSSASLKPINLQQLRSVCESCGLHQLCLPAGIGLKAVQQLEGIVQSKRPYERGQYLFQPGMHFHSLFVVRSGSFKTFTASATGELQILGFHLPGEIVGLDAINKNQHQCTAEALERSSICEIPYEHLNQVATEIPELHLQLMRIVSREIGYGHEHLTMMGRKQAQERLAIFLKNMITRYTRLHRDPNLLTLSMSRYDLANYLGLVIETISRLFSRMQASGILQVDRKRITIYDLPALERLIEPPQLNPTIVQNCNIH